MKKKDIEKHFEVVIPREEPIFPVNIVCELLHMNYWTLHEVLKEGIIKPKGKAKKKKLLSYKDMTQLKYVQYLIQEKGVNIKGVKVILEMRHEE